MNTPILDRYAQQRRWAEMPEPIRQIALQNPIVQQVLHRYAAGDICTREEALCQMVMALARGGDELRDLVIRQAAMSGWPFAFPPGKEERQ